MVMVVVEIGFPGTVVISIFRIANIWPGTTPTSQIVAETVFPLADMHAVTHVTYVGIWELA